MGYTRDDLGDEAYFEPTLRKSEGFDARLLREPLGVIPARKPLVFQPDATVTDAMRAMQREHRGCVLVTDDGTQKSKLLGIFTERDVLFRIVDKGRNPAALAVGDVMTVDPENLSDRSTVAYVLNKMSVGGFRHVPVVDDEHRPVCVISVRDVVSFLVEAFPREVLNLPAEPDPTVPRAREGA
jgi:CBS domain-containing protein